MTKCETILENVSMSELLDKYGMPSRRGQYHCCFHSPDKNASASVTKDDKWYRCFACGVIVNVIDFVAKYDQCTRKVAIAKLNEMFKLGLNGELTAKEKAEIRQAQEKRRLAKEKAERENRLVECARRKVLDDLRMWEETEAYCCSKRSKETRQYNERFDMFFYSLKQQRWLSWVYSRLTGMLNEECEFDYYDIAELSRANIAQKVLANEI